MKWDRERMSALGLAFILILVYLFEGLYVAFVVFVGVVLGMLYAEVLLTGKFFGKKNKNKWKYHECKNCYVMWPHLATPDVCTCGNDMTKNYNEKEVDLVTFKDCSQSINKANNLEDSDGNL